MGARLRVAAISFLNPAPLLYDFEHEPARAVLAQRYDVRYTTPAQCAAQLRSGTSGLGLVPIAALPTLPSVQAVPGCVIASPHHVRSIQLVLRPGQTLETIRTIAADRASRSSAAYVQTLLRTFHNNAPTMDEMPASLAEMLAAHDAALLIGDPALLALEARDTTGACTDHAWVDVASWWHSHTGLPWVAAVWAVAPSHLAKSTLTAAKLIHDLQASRDCGLANVGRIVHEWSGRIALPPATIRTYLTENIAYTLDDRCLQAIHRFFQLAEACGVLPSYIFRTLPQ